MENFEQLVTSAANMFAMGVSLADIHDNLAAKGLSESEIFLVCKAAGQLLADNN